MTSPAAGGGNRVETSGADDVVMGTRRRPSFRYSAVAWVPDAAEEAGSGAPAAA